MKENLKKMLAYYKPYRRIFFADLFFAAVSAACALAIPLVVRYVTGILIYRSRAEILSGTTTVALLLLALLLVDAFSRYFIGNYGHVMGAKMEYDMRADLFCHMQQLSF